MGNRAAVTSGTAPLQGPRARACERPGGQGGPYSVGVLVGLDDARRDATAVADGVPVPAGPLADGTGLLAVHASAARPGAAAAGGTATATHLARGRDVPRERVAQLLGVLLGEIDLVIRSVETEAHRLVGGEVL